MLLKVSIYRINKVIKVNFDILNHKKECIVDIANVVNGTIND